MMSSSVCHAPLPARMEAFTTRLCLRAVDQYERLLQAHFHKSASKEQSRLSHDSRSEKEHRHQQHQQHQQQQLQNNKNHHHYQQQQQQQQQQHLHRRHNHHHSRRKDASNTAVSAFKHWRRSTSMGNRSNNHVPADEKSQSTERQIVAKLPNDLVNQDKLEQFPMVLSDTTMPDEDLSLKFLALNALDLTVPASDVLLKNRLKSWFQLSGHPDGFAPAGPGTVWKRRTGGPENTERAVYEALSKDKAMKDCIPRYYREVEYKGDTFIELQDLLFGFNDPHVMDIKMGTRTFLESEVSKTTARPDLYQKMIAVDPTAPTPQEHEQKAVTKLRYMQFREQQSSTCSHGFRIEAIKLPGEPPITDLKKVKSHEEVIRTMKRFLGAREDTRQKLLEKLVNLRSKVEESVYFRNHEVIGSSVFMIYDNEKVGVWLIDFAKTCRLQNGHTLTHRKPWERGNHEEGFLLGLDNLIQTIEEVSLS